MATKKALTLSGITSDLNKAELEFIKQYLEIPKNTVFGYSGIGHKYINIKDTNEIKNAINTAISLLSSDSKSGLSVKDVSINSGVITVTFSGTDLTLSLTEE